MSKIRIYELAKELDKSNQEIIALLQENKIEVKSHMSVVDDETANRIRTIYEEREKLAGIRPKKRKIKRGMFYYLNPKNLATEVSRYGYSFSLKGFWKFYLLAFAALIGLGFLYSLKIPYIAVVILFTIFLSPSIILTIYRGAYEQKRFMDVTNYIEQLLYSFKRVPKILTALEDSLVVFPEGKMHDLILKTIENIQNKEVKGDIYQEAFYEMEEEYDCRRLKQVHEFLIKVEKLGGDFSSAIDILLEDRQLWVSRVYELAQERKSIGRNIIISLVLASGICKMTMIMMPSDFAALDNPVSQFMTMMFMITSIFIWFIGQKKLQPSWLSDGMTKEADIKRNYDYVKSYDRKTVRKKTIIKCLCVIPIFALVWYMKNTSMMLIVGILFLFIFIQPSLHLKNAKKKIMREVDKSFPIWLMELSLLLQTENVHNALAKSLEHAPYVLKEDLESMVDHIEKNPNSIEPYLNFMPCFDLPDVQSALRLIYSMSEFGADNEEKQISILVNRNNKLLDKAERLANEDSLAGVGTLVLLPMVTGSIKMMTDMGLLLVSLISITGAM